jgi:YidC/Oxa1 family membrane protein insertase
MNKTETLMVVLLFAVLLGWMTLIKPKQVEKANAAAAAAASNQVSTVVTELPAPAGEPTLTEPKSPLQVEPVPPPVTTPSEPARERASEAVAVVSNEHVVVTFTTWGGGVKSVELLHHDRSVTNRDEHVLLDFSNGAALTLNGVPALPQGGDFELVSHSSTGVVFEAAAGGVTLVRELTLGDGYELTLTDSYINASGEAVVVPARRLASGPMKMQSSDPMSTRYGYLGVDTLATEPGARPVQWGKKILKDFGGGGGCSRGPAADQLPPVREKLVDGQQEWVAAKSKHFIQVVTPEGGCEGARILAYRDLTSKRDFVMGSVVAEMGLPELTVAPGTTHTMESSYYAGPTKYAELKKLGGSQHRAMFRTFKGFGWWRAACVGLLYLLNGIYAVVRNYGVAIIVLTVLVKVALWPLTHKSTESMRKMQKLQPEIKKIRDRYKDPQKQQQKIMLLYREHGANPLMGCLPMFLQMPVFIALFTVLRGAVELRLATFIPPWIQDLSASEGLLKGAMAGFPLVQELNILPLLMTATTLWQQKLQPTNADPQQKQMMYMMPVMFLFFFYKMPSGLVLYWTVSQLLSIVQVYWRNVQVAREEAAASGVINV